jgi:NMD protein affecting ribosome stability and mRNA decay
VSDFNPEAIFAKLNATGEDWVDKNAAAEILEETKKSVLAELMNALEGPKTEREARALADPTYRLHITNMVTARKEANRARVKYDSMRVLAEMRRTQESTRRAEANIR